MLDGFRFQNWSFYDTEPNATNTSHIPSQYAVFLNWGLGSITDVTIRNSEFVGQQRRRRAARARHGARHVRVQQGPRQLDARLDVAR